MRYYVVGDTGGHSSQLFEGLKKLGVDLDSHIIPDDITIIHLGDLIHKGPSTSLKLLRFVQRMQSRNPGRWVQLVGNHEMQHIDGGIQFWRCSCGAETEELMTEMFANGDIRAAHYATNLKPNNLSLSKRDTFVPETKDWLFTHGGLTRLWWDKAHNSNPDVKTLSEDINRLPVRLLTSPGERLGYPRNPASPVWASAPTEVFTGWWERGSMPFNQAAGHTYIFDWERHRWFGRPSRELRAATKLNETLRVSLTKISDSLLVVADPGFEKAAPTVEAQPIIFVGEN